MLGMPDKLFNYREITVKCSIKKLDFAIKFLNAVFVFTAISHFIIFFVSFRLSAILFASGSILIYRNYSLP